MTASLYYDGACPLCAREIALLKRLLKRPINLVDIHTLDTSFYPDKETLLKHLHLRQANGEWLVGLDANLHIWSYTAYGFLLKPLKLWPFHWLARTLYEKWASRRFEQRYQCQRCAKQ